MYVPPLSESAAFHRLVMESEAGRVNTSVQVDIVDPVVFVIVYWPT